MDERDKDRLDELVGRAGDEDPDALIRELIGRLARDSDGPIRVLGPGGETVGYCFGPDGQHPPTHEPWSSGFFSSLGT